MRFPLPSRWFLALEFCQQLISGCLNKEEIESLKQEMELILTFLADGHFLVDIAKDIVIIKFSVETGNRIIKKEMELFWPFSDIANSK